MKTEIKPQHTPRLLRCREIVEKDGIDLDDIFYVRSYVRLWDYGSGYQVTAQQSGNGRDYFNQTFKTLDEAQNTYDTVKGVLAIAKAEGK
jgi:hypothetical protein